MITTGERGVGGFERGVWGWFGVGDKCLKLSVGGEKVREKNETATDFRQ